MEFFDWNISFTLTSPLIFLECYLVQGTLVCKETSEKTVNADVQRACNDITRFAFKFLDEMVARRVSVRHLPGWSPSVMAAFALYKAREEIIVKRRNTWMGEVWPPELQVLTLISGPHMSELVEGYKECLKLQRDVLHMEPRGEQQEGSRKYAQLNRREEPREQVERSVHNFERQSAEIISALEAAKNGAFRTKKKMSTVTKIELVPRASHKDALLAE